MKLASETSVLAELSRICFASLTATPPGTSSELLYYFSVQDAVTPSAELWPFAVTVNLSRLLCHT